MELNATAKSAPAPATPKNWQLGAGLELLTSSIALTDLVVLTTNGNVDIPIVINGPTPRLNLALERRVARGSWVGLEVTASTSTSSNNAVSSSGTFIGAVTVTEKLTQSSTSGGLRLLFRQVLNPGGAVEFSVYAGVGVGDISLKESVTVTTIIPSTNGSPGSTTSNSATASLSELEVDGKAGVVAERELLEGLSVRVALNLLNIDYLKSNQTGTEPDGTPAPPPETSKSFTANVDFEPSLSLRLLF